MPDCHCELHIRQEACKATLRVNGRVTMHHCSAVRRWADECLDHTVQQLRVDLRGCSYMDSTFVGTLLGLYRRCKSREMRSLTLVTPSPACRQVLKQMHLHEILAVIDEPEATDSLWLKLPLDGEEQTAILRQVVRAHQELASLPGEVGQNFRCIADELAAEISSTDSMEK